MSSYHEIIRLMIQSWGFIIAAEAICVSFAINDRRGAGLFAAAALTAIMLIMYRRFLAHAFPFAIAAVSAERHLRPGQGAVLTTYYRINYPKTYAAIVSILDSNDADMRATLPVSWSPMMKTMAAATVAQTISSILICTAWNYPFL